MPEGNEVLDVADRPGIANRPSPNRADQYSVPESRPDDRALLYAPYEDGWSRVVPISLVDLSSQLPHCHGT